MSYISANLFTLAINDKIAAMIRGEVVPLDDAYAPASVRKSAARYANSMYGGRRESALRAAAKQREFDRPDYEKPSSQAKELSADEAERMFGPELTNKAMNRGLGDRAMGLVRGAKQKWSSMPQKHKELAAIGLGLGAAGAGYAAYKAYKNRKAKKQAGQSPAADAAQKAEKAKQAYYSGLYWL